MLATTQKDLRNDINNNISKDEKETNEESNEKDEDNSEANNAELSLTLTTATSMPCLAHKLEQVTQLSLISKVFQSTMMECIHYSLQSGTTMETYNGWLIQNPQVPVSMQT